jgi:hypothetical protein
MQNLTEGQRLLIRDQELAKEYQANKNNQKNMQKEILSNG